MREPSVNISISDYHKYRDKKQKMEIRIRYLEENLKRVRRERLDLELKMSLTNPAKPITNEYIYIDDPEPSIKENFKVSGLGFALLIFVSVGSYFLGAI